MISNVRSGQQLRDFRGQVASAFEPFDHLALNVRLGLARDPILAFPWAWNLVAGLEPGLRFASAQRIYAGVADPLRTPGERGFAMGDSRAERDPFMVTVRSLATMATGHYSETSLARLALDAERKTGRFIGGASAVVYRAGQEDKYTYGEPQGNQKTLIFEDWLTYLTERFARFETAKPILRGLRALSRNAGGTSRFAADHLSLPSVAAQRFPRLDPSLSGIRVGGVAAEDAAAKEGYETLVRLLELHVVRNVAAIAGLNTQIVLPDSPGEDKADAHRKRRLRQARMGTALSLMPFLATYAFDRAHVRHPLISYYFETWLEGVGHGPLWQEITQTLDSFTYLPADLASVVAEIGESQHTAAGWDGAPVSAALMDAHWLTALITPEGSNKPLDPANLQRNQARIPGRFQPKRALLESKDRFPAVFDHARRLYAMLRGSQESDPSTFGGAYVAMARAMHFITVPSPRLGDAPLADTVIVTNGLGSAMAPPSAYSMALAKRSLPSAASGSPILVGVKDSRMAVAVAKAGGLVRELGTDEAEQAGLALAISDFRNPDYVMVETTPLEDDVLLAGADVSPRAYIGLKPQDTELTPNALPKGKNGGKEDPLKTALMGSKEGTLDQLLRNVGDEVEIFPNTLAEWARRLTMTTEDFEAVVISNPEHWTHLMVITESLIGAGKRVEPHPDAPLAATSTVLRQLAESVGAAIPTTNPVWWGFEDFEPVTAWRPREDCAVRDGRTVDPTAFSVRVPLTEEAEAYAPTTT